jgi:pimeloyl-ACP methyl ester carboxylesterase
MYTFTNLLLLAASLFVAAGDILAQTPIDSAGYVTIGGIKQFVSIKGNDNSRPLLLFLHGGPGNSVMSYAEKFTNLLQRHFVVVQWDQRESGKTRTLNKSPQSLTVGLFEEDTRQLVDTLLRRFNREKLYLAGHSWGSVLGFYMAKNYPDLLYAYIPICPMINQLQSERTVLAMMKERAQKSGNQKALEEMATVKVPFENGEQLFYHRKWLLSFMGSKARITGDQVIEWSKTWLHVFNDASKNNLLESLQTIRCPVYFFVGRKDYQTNSNITKAYFEQLNAPKKGIFWFEKSGHSVPTTEPALLQAIIIEKILPETK